MMTVAITMAGIVAVITAGIATIAIAGSNGAITAV